MSILRFPNSVSQRANRCLVLALCILVFACYNNISLTPQFICHRSHGRITMRFMIRYTPRSNIRSILICIRVVSWALILLSVWRILRQRQNVPFSCYMHVPTTLQALILRRNNGCNFLIFSNAKTSFHSLISPIKDLLAGHSRRTAMHHVFLHARV